jgi:hypothetical protein
MIASAVFTATEPAGVFLSWGIFSIQLGNLVVILVMLLLFALALVLPFPRGRRGR